MPLLKVDTAVPDVLHKHHDDPSLGSCWRDWGGADVGTRMANGERVDKCVANAAGVLAVRNVDQIVKQGSNLESSKDVGQTDAVDEMNRS